MKTVLVPFPLLDNLRIRVMVFTKADEYIEWRKKHWDDQKEKYPAASCLGWQRGPLNYDVDIVMMKPAIRHPKSALVHEAVHAVQFVCENYAIKDVEFSAYLTEYIVKVCMKKGIV